MAAHASCRPEPSRRPRRNLTYREKLAIVQKKEEEPAWTQRNLSLWAKETFRLESRPTQATISNLLRGKDKLLSAAVPPEFRSARRVKHPELDQKMLRWVHAELQRGGVMTRTCIQSRAVELAQEMQLSSDVRFSKGWVSSFMNRHQLKFSMKGGGGAEQEAVKQGMLAVTAEAVKRAELDQVQQVQEDTEEEEEEEEEEKEDEEIKETEMTVEIDNSMEVEEEHVDEVQGRNWETEPSDMPPTASSVTEDMKPRPNMKRRRVETKDGGGSLWQSTTREEKGRTTEELLLDWIAVPGSYSRWWLLQSNEEKEPLFDEINLFLRSHGLRGMSSAGIRQQITALVTTFQAAQTWLRQTGVKYPLNAANMTLEQERIKSHVLHMCPHYKRLVSILAAYVDFDDSTATPVQESEAPEANTDGITTPAVGNAAPVTQARDMSVGVESPPKPTMISQQGGTECTVDNTSDDDTKAQKRRLFELECARLQSEIETRNIQLVLEKTLARKKLLDAGISPEEVDRIFPL